MHISDKYFEIFFRYRFMTNNSTRWHEVMPASKCVTHKLPRCVTNISSIRNKHIGQVVFIGTPCNYIKWVWYFIILTIIWLSGVHWTSSDHQSDPIVTKAFQNPDGNCPSIYTQSKHYLSTIGSKLHHRKTIWPILDRMKFYPILPPFYPISTVW